MKRALWVVALVVIAGCLSAQEVYETNSVVVAWDAVTTFVDGAPVPAEDTILYQVYTAPADDNSTTSFYDQTSLTSIPVTFTAEGQYNVGVRAVRVQPGGEESYSLITWGDFIVQYVRAPAAPVNLRVE